MQCFPGTCGTCCNLYKINVSKLGEVGWYYVHTHCVLEMIQLLCMEPVLNNIHEL